MQPQSAVGITLYPFGTLKEGIAFGKNDLTVKYCRIVEGYINIRICRSGYPVIPAVAAGLCPADIILIQKIKLKRRFPENVKRYFGVSAAVIYTCNLHLIVIGQLRLINFDVVDAFVCVIHHFAAAQPAEFDCITVVDGSIRTIVYGTERQEVIGRS